MFNSTVLLYTVHNTLYTIHCTLYTVIHLQLYLTIPSAVEADRVLSDFSVEMSARKDVFDVMCKYQETCTPATPESVCINNLYLVLLVTLVLVVVLCVVL